MATVTTPCEGTNAAAVTAANTGASRNFDVISGTMTFTTTQKHGGASGIAASVSSQLIWTVATAKMFSRGYFYIPATLTADTTIAAQYYTTSVRGVQFVCTATNMFPRLQTQGSGTLTTRATGGSALPLNTWLRRELYGDAGSTATNGQARAAVFVGDSTTPLWDSGLITGVDVAGTTGQLVQDRHNVNSTFIVDDLGYKDGADAAWATWISVAPPAGSTPAPAVVQRVDFTAWSGAASLTAAQTSGPTVTLSISGLVATFDDSAPRTVPVVFDFTVTGPGGTDVETVTVDPITAHDSLRYRIWDGTTLG